MTIKSSTVSKKPPNEDILGNIAWKWRDYVSRSLTSKSLAEFTDQDVRGINSALVHMDTMAAWRYKVANNGYQRSLQSYIDENGQPLEDYRSMRHPLFGAINPFRDTLRAPNFFAGTVHHLSDVGPVYRGRSSISFIGVAYEKWCEQVDNHQLEDSFVDFLKFMSETSGKSTLSGMTLRRLSEASRDDTGVVEDWMPEDGPSARDMPPSALVDPQDWCPEDGR